MAAIAFSQFVQTGERDTRVKLFGRKLLSTSTREGFTSKKPTSHEKIPRLVNTIMCHSLSSGEQDFDVLKINLNFFFKDIILPVLKKTFVLTYISTSK